MSLASSSPSTIPAVEKRRFKATWQQFLLQNKTLSATETAWTFWQTICDAKALSPEQLGFYYEMIATAEKGQGLFYTPDFLADYLVSQSLGKALRYQLSEAHILLQTAQWEKLQALIASVKAWRVLDPACGCGIFLFKALKAFHHFYDALQQLLLHADSTTLPAEIKTALPLFGARYALTYQVYGVDIDPLAVALCEWGLSETTQALDQAAFFPIQGASNILNGQALASKASRSLQNAQNRLQCKQIQMTPREETHVPRTCLPSAANPSEFSWEASFPEVDAWDFILGNPPYITEVRQQGEHFSFLREHSRIAEDYQAKMDLCDAFVLLGLQLLTPSGHLAFVLPAYWTHRASGRGLRERLWTAGYIREFWTFPKTTLFPRASGHHSSLLVFQKDPTPHHKDDCVQETQWGEGIHRTEPQVETLKPARLFWSPLSGTLSYGRQAEIEVLEVLSRLPQKLLAPDEIQQGMVLPHTTLSAKDWQRLPPQTQAHVQPGQGIFVLTSDEVEALGLSPTEQACLRPYYAPHPFEAFTGFGSRPSLWVIYADIATKERFLGEPARYLKLRAHLERFEAINTSSHKPYGLHRARQPHWFEDPRKILGLRQTEAPCFAIVPQAAYVNESFYVLCPAETRLSREEMVWILNSRLALFWFSKQKQKGSRLQIDKDVLLTFPAPPTAQQKRQIVPSQQTVQRDINAWVYALYGLTEVHIEAIEAKLTRRSLLHAGQLGNNP